MHSKPIGVYDSGVGGLTVLKHLQMSMPHEHFIYVGDTAHVPYGTKKPEEILQYSKDIIDFLVDEKHAKCVVAACHTSSAIALDQIDVGVPLIGTLRAPLMDIVATYPAASIGVLATPASTKSQMHAKRLKEFGFQGECITVACPKLVPLIEAGDLNSFEIGDALDEYLQAFNFNEIKAILYGCTHYPFLHTIIRELVPEEIKLIDPAAAIAEEVRRVSSHPQVQEGSTEYFTTGPIDAFRRSVELLVGHSSSVMAI